MKAIIQTVKDASCSVGERLISEMKEGLLVYFGVEKDDKIEDLEAFLLKIFRLRIYRGEEDMKTNYLIIDRSSSTMLISQFTRWANLMRGNRPSFDNAMSGEKAKVFYDKAIEILRREKINVSVGAFGEHMHIKYTNDGPETFILSK